MKKFNPYRNIFYYYRGQNHIDKKADTQIEDNTTKALINTLEFSDKSLLDCLLKNLKISIDDNLFPSYDLQVSELLSRPDAVIKIGKNDIYIESKVQATLDKTQIINHINSIGKSTLIVITPRKDDQKIIKNMNSRRLKHTTWDTIYIQFKDYLEQRGSEKDFILKQFLNYLESINMAPFSGFQKNDFDAFLNVEEDPKKEIRTIVKNKFRKLLDELYIVLNSISDFQGLKIEVGNVQKESQSIWGTLSDIAKSKVNVPHYNFLINRNGFSVGFIVEGKIPAKKFYKNIENNSDRFFNILKNLDNYEIELQNRIYIRPRKYKNETVATIKCGKEITKYDVEYIIQKAAQYKLILTWCRTTIPRDLILPPNSR